MSKCFDCQSNGPGVVHALMMRSCASQKRSRDVAGLKRVEWYSMPVPRTNPEMMRPPEITSSIATDSATLSGFPCSGSAFPMTPIRRSFVRATMCDAITFGSGIVPYAFWWCSFTQVPSNPSFSASTAWSRYSL